MLMTKGTSDETFRYISQTRERSMQKGLVRMRTPDAPGQTETRNRCVPHRGPAPATAGRVPADGPAVVADDRETASRVVEALRLDGAALEIAHLENGDYAIGDRILVERKTARDFVDTLVERDLLGQIRSLADAARSRSSSSRGATSTRIGRSTRTQSGARSPRFRDSTWGSRSFTRPTSADGRPPARARAARGGGPGRTEGPPAEDPPARPRAAVVRALGVPRCRAEDRAGPSRGLRLAHRRARGHPAALESVPGVGAKTAARLHEFVRQGY